MFANAPCLCQMRYKQIEPYSCLGINVSKVAVELATENEVVVEHRTVFYEISQVLSAPNTDGVDFFFQNDQTRQIIISMQFIPKSVAVVVDIFLHSANLHVSFEIDSSEWL